MSAAQLEALRAENERVRTLGELYECANQVSNDLEEYGPSIVPNLLDTDENDGQRLREKLVEVFEFLTTPTKQEK